MTLSYFSCLSFEGCTAPRQWHNRLYGYIILPSRVESSSQVDCGWTAILWYIL